MSPASHWRFAHENFLGMSDQAVVLFSCAFLDRALERAILTRMRKLKSKYHRQLFLGTGPLSSFWAKIRLAYSLALFGPETYEELDKLREIRNVFAHAAHPVKFGTKRIATHCKKLRLGNTQPLPQ